MPQSLSKIIVHTIFSTKDRRPFLRDKALREELHYYLGGILAHHDCQPLSSHVLLNVTNQDTENSEPPFYWHFQLGADVAEFLVAVLHTPLMWMFGVETTGDGGRAVTRPALVAFIYRFQRAAMDQP